MRFSGILEQQPIAPLTSPNKVILNTEKYRNYFPRRLLASYLQAWVDGKGLPTTDGSRAPNPAGRLERSDVF